MHHNHVYMTDTCVGRLSEYYIPFCKLKSKMSVICIFICETQ